MFSTQVVTVSLDWPKGMLPDTGVEVMSLSRATSLLLGSFSDTIPQGDDHQFDASEKDAVASHIASKFWIDTVKTTNTIHEFNIKLGDKTTKIYSLRGATSATLRNIDLKDKLLVDRAIHAAINYMNESIVDRFARHANVMTPLARVAITDDALLEMSDITGCSVANIVKRFNVATARKVQQLATVNYYVPELAMACLIRSSFSQVASQTTKTIGLKQMAKIANTAGIGGIDQSRVSAYLGFLSSNETMKANVEDLIADAKKMKTLARDPIAKQSVKLLLAMSDDLISDADECAIAVPTRRTGAISKSAKK